MEYYKIPLLPKKKHDLEQVEQNKSIGRKCSESYVFLRLPLLYDDG